MKPLNLSATPRKWLEVALQTLYNLGDIGYTPEMYQEAEELFTNIAITFDRLITTKTTLQAKAKEIETKIEKLSSKDSPLEAKNKANQAEIDKLMSQLLNVQSEYNANEDEIRSFILYMMPEATDLL
ncbi:MAG: hypothetical protein LBT86_03810 [Deltaproteobacteria bacterium]|jgi:predicted nuclease with TOPRIM domain|nr:hypothetical protein [Deltaproteobacteria bacterium]